MSQFSHHLRYVADICPLPGSPIRSMRHTRWYAEAHAKASSLLEQPQGYTQEVMHNRLLVWSRTFSTLPPSYGGIKGGSHMAVRSDKDKPPLLVLSEWIPEHHPKLTQGWRAFGPAYTCAYARLSPTYTKDWRGHAKKHLKTFLRSGCNLRWGSYQDVANLYQISQVPKSLQTNLLKMLARHLEVHPKTIDILVAEKDNQAIACLVSGNCDEVNTSEYLIGAFHPDYKHLYAMVGLVDWWYQLSLKRGYAYVNFGHIEPPPKLFSSSQTGYSFFKTHFGVSRVWFPGNYWKVFINR